MKTLDSNNKNFEKILDALLLKRKNKVKSNSVSVTNIIKDVKKMVIRQYLNMRRNLIKTM